MYFFTKLNTELSALKSIKKSCNTVVKTVLN